MLPSSVETFFSGYLLLFTFFRISTKGLGRNQSVILFGVLSILIRNLPCVDAQHPSEALKESSVFYSMPHGLRSIYNGSVLNPFYSAQARIKSSFVLSASTLWSA